MKIETSLWEAICGVATDFGLSVHGVASSLAGGGKAFAGTAFLSLPAKIFALCASTADILVIAALFYVEKKLFEAKHPGVNPWYFLTE